MSRIIGVLTTGRWDYGICTPILRAIEQASDLELQLLVTGAHLSPEFGNTVEEIRADGFEISNTVEILLSSDSPEGVAKAVGLASMGFSQVFSHSRPDMLLVVGDRFEVHAIVSAAIPFRIPVAHVHGGEVTRGAVDDLYRHAITKMSHLHFATTPDYGNRIRQMGEEAWRIHVTGAPGIDNFTNLTLPKVWETEVALGVDLSTPTLLSTYHPVTQEADSGYGGLESLLSGIQELDLSVIFTHPNMDSSGRRITARIREFVEDYAKATVLVNASQPHYLNLMRSVSAMAGNSSSGIIEAASFELPVVNIGSRQEGRVRARNVIDAAPDADAVVAALGEATSPSFRKSLAGMDNPYGSGKAGEAIADVLSKVDISPGLLLKRFVDLTPASSEDIGC
jgi:GDP/UDP-N,N'-diacetylbacillosamine 2-epimerase (hydrolysing)